MVRMSYSMWDQYTRKIEAAQSLEDIKNILRDLVDDMYEQTPEGDD